MERRPTTRCCSAIASVVVMLCLASIGLGAQSREKPDTRPLALTPLRTIWTLTLNARLSAAPAFADTHAYFPTDDGRLLAYDLTSGESTWVVDANAQFEPAVGQGMIFLAEPSQISARRLDDGSLAWQQPWSEELAAPPVWDNEWLVLAAKSGQIAALRASDGMTIWTQAIGRPVTTRPALAADRVYISTDDSRVIALSVQTGEMLWSRRLGGPATSLMALADQVYAGSVDNYFYCLLPSNGQVDWRWRAGADPIGRPVVDADNVYFVGLDNLLRAHSRGHGVQRWVQPLPIRPTRGPLMAGNALLVTGITPTLRIYNVKDGKPAGEFATAGEIAADPYVVANTASGLPQIAIVTRDIAKGTIVTLTTRQIEPKIQPLGALPNPVKLPVLPSTATPAETPATPDTTSATPITAAPLDR